jgi:hypothetical protein
MGAIGLMGGNQEFGCTPAKAHDSWSICPNLHPFKDLFGTGRDGIYLSFYLNEAEPAGCFGRFFFLDGAKIGNVDSIFQGNPQDPCSFGGQD